MTQLRRLIPVNAPPDFTPCVNAFALVGGLDATNTFWQFFHEVDDRVGKSEVDPLEAGEIVDFEVSEVQRRNNVLLGDRP